MKEEIRTNQLIKKIIIAILFVFLFNFVFVNLGNNIVFADEIGEPMNDDEMKNAGGGVILPVLNKFLVFLGDAVLGIMQNNFVSSQPVTIRASAGEMQEINGWAIFGIVVGAIVLVGASIVTCGAVAAGTAAVRSGCCYRACSSGNFCNCSRWSSCRRGCYWSFSYRRYSIFN